MCPPRSIPAAQTITATAKVRFRAVDASGIVRVELHPNLNVSDVKSEQGGSPENSNGKAPAHSMYALQLPSRRASQYKGYAHIFFITGVLANEGENSPLPGVRLASIYKEGCVFAAASSMVSHSRRIPRIASRAHFDFNVPDSFAMAGTGKSLAPAAARRKKPLPKVSRLSVRFFECTRSAPNGTFVAGKS